MPRGIPNKKKETLNEAQAQTEERNVLTEVRPIAETVTIGSIDVEPVQVIAPAPVNAPKPVDPLSKGQCHFEAPDGTIIAGDETRDQIWYRQGNKGKGMWINKKR